MKILFTVPLGRSDFIKYAEYLYDSGATRQSTVTSVFDLLYAEYAEALLARFDANPKEHKTELLMCGIIMQLLKEYPHISYGMHVRLSKLVTVPDTFRAEERSYILHPWTHVDFLFYNKVSREHLFVLEVDGIRYHEQDRQQSLHDAIKNRILEHNNIPIHRFKTNESNETERLSGILNMFVR